MLSAACDAGGVYENRIFEKMCVSISLIDCLTTDTSVVNATFSAKECPSSSQRGTGGRVAVPLEQHTLGSPVPGGMIGSKHMVRLLWQQAITF